MRTELRLQQCRDTDIARHKWQTASILPKSQNRCSNSSCSLEESTERMPHCLEGSCRTNSAGLNTSVAVHTFDINHSFVSFSLADMGWSH